MLGPAIGADVALSALADWPYEYFALARLLILAASVTVWICAAMGATYGRDTPTGEKWFMFAAAIPAIFWFLSGWFEFPPTTWMAIDIITAIALIVLGLVVGPFTGPKPTGPWVVYAWAAGVTAFVIGPIYFGSDDGRVAYEHDTRGGYCTEYE